MTDFINIATILNEKALEALLIDKTTKNNIIWATDNYAEKGGEYAPTAELKPELTDVIQSRVMKAADEQLSRTRSKAEVFTPSWLCNKMNNHCDEEWFGRPDVFNIETENSWETISEKVEFPQDKTWQEYIESLRIEITCGEAPYLVSRYDTTTGKYIPIADRIGLLDRKLRVVNENTTCEEEWLEWAYKAFRSIYGYEFQGDNLLIARINLLLTFCEYLEDRWGRKPKNQEIKKLANIICWNIWQMDGLTDTIPLGTPEPEVQQVSLFDFMVGAEEKEYTPICRIYDWKANRSILYTDLKKGK